MILYHNAVETVKTNAVLYSNNEAVRKLAIMMMVNAAEANTDMVMDCPDQYTSKEEIEAVYLHLNELALETLEDHIHDLRLNLEKFLQTVKFRARVTRLEYAKVDGKLNDVTVELEVE